ncbi:MAG: helix-turn-helix transcriptional regulator [Methanomicrobiales archaeon]
MKIFSTGRRMEVLDALRAGEGKETIKKRLPASSFAFSVDFLRKVEFVEEIEGDLRLTDKGRAYLVAFSQFRDGIGTIRTLFDAFPDHVIHFPDQFYGRLSEIGSATVITSEPSNVLKPHRVYFDHLSRSRDINGVSPILFPDYPDTFRGLAETAETISLVVTDEIWDVIREYPIHEYDNIAVYLLDEPPRLAVTATDTFLSIGFFYRSGSYDFTRDLVATDTLALRFGCDLVSYYRRKARRIV